MAILSCVNDRKGSRSLHLRLSHQLAAITIRVPGPFAGVGALGFSARYPDQSLLAPLRDVPLWIEGPPPEMRRLLHRLRMLAEAAGRAYSWTPPVQLAEEVVIVAFRDQGLDAAPAGAAFSSYFANLVRPVVFPFLADCAALAHLRLADRIAIAVESDGVALAHLEFRTSEIVEANGFDLLGDAA